MSRFNIVYPPKGRVTFDGGLNVKFPRAEIPDNESPDCFNVLFTNGAVEARGGSTKLNTTAIGSFVGDGIYTRHDNAGTETMVVFANGTGYTWSGSTFATIGSAQSVFTAGVRVAAAEYENHLFCGNGGVNPYKWNGTAWTRHGVPAATGAVTVASQAAGVLTGDYRYKITYVNSQSVEGDVGTSTVTITAAGATLRLTGIPTAPQSHGVSSRRVYRTSAAGGTWYRVATIADNTTTVYDDNTADGSLGAAAPTDQGEPPKYNAIVAHQGRLFCNDTANPNYLWYSEIYEPYTFKATSFQPAGDGSFDLIRGLAVHDNAVVLLCDGGIYMLYTPSATATDWRLIKTRSPFGSKSPFGTFLYENKLMFPAIQSSKFVGFAALHGATIDPSATSMETAMAGSELKSDRIESEMFDVQEAYTSRISAMVFKNKAYMAVTDGDGNTTNNRLYVFDFSRSNLAKRQEASWVPVSGLNVCQFTVYDAKLYALDSTATGLYVRQIETTTRNDDGTAVNAYLWTKEFSGNKGHENLQKDFRKVNMLVDKSGAYYMNLTYRVDSDNGDGVTKQVNLNPGSTIWGAFLWGGAMWGGGSAQEEVTVWLGSVTGKRIQFKFSNQNTVNQTFKVHGLNFTYNIKGRR